MVVRGAGLADNPPTPPRRQALQRRPLGPAQAWGWVFVIARNPETQATLSRLEGGGVLSRLFVISLVFLNDLLKMGLMAQLHGCVVVIKGHRLSAPEFSPSISLHPCSRLPREPLPRQQWQTEGANSLPVSVTTLTPGHVPLLGGLQPTPAVTPSTPGSLSVTLGKSLEAQRVGPSHPGSRMSLEPGQQPGAKPLGSFLCQPLLRLGAAV